MAAGQAPASVVFTEQGRNDQMAAQVLDQGLRERALEDWLELTGLPRLPVLAAFGLPPQTLAFDHYRPLNLTVAERLIRASDLLVRVRRVFGDGAVAWMPRDHERLDGKSPLLAAQDESGGACVRDMLIAVEHGGVV